MARNRAPRYNSLSVGFCRKESLRAIEMAAGCGERRELRDRVVKLLRQRAKTTRERIANKLIQRYLAGEKGRLRVGPFAELVGGIKDQTSRTQLLYYRLTQVDELVGALAREVVYPYFIERAVPKGFKRDEFFAINGQRLIDEDPYLLSPFLDEFATRNWRVKPGDSLGQAMRILADAGFVERRRIRSVFRHPYALYPAKNDATMTAFVYALYDELGGTKGALPEARLVESTFARTLLMPPDIVRHMVRNCRQYGFLRRQRKTGDLTLTYGSLAAAVADLREAAM